MPGDVMKIYLQNLTITAFGVLASIATALILFMIEAYFDFSLYTWTFWFVIPVGAIAAGFLAAGGYYLGARLFGHRPTAMILINMISVSIGTFFLIHWLSYITLAVEGTPVSNFISFGTYLDMILIQSSVQFSLEGHEVGSTGQMGAWGYAYAALQIGGFAFGGLAVYGWLRSLAFCEDCSQYLEKKGQQTRYSADSEEFIQIVKQLTIVFEENQLQQAIDMHASFGKEEEPEDLELGSDFKSNLIHKACKSCSINWIEFTAQRWEKTDIEEWKDLDDLEFGKFYKGQIKING